MDNAYGTVKKSLEENREKLDGMAEALLEYETIDRKQIDDIMAGRKPHPPEELDDKDDLPTPDVEPEEDQKPHPTGSVGDPAAEH